MYFLYVCFYHVQYVCHRMHIVWSISYKASIKCIRRVDVLIDSVSSNLRDCAAAQLPKTLFTSHLGLHSLLTCDSV